MSSNSQPRTESPSPAMPEVEPDTNKPNTSYELAQKFAAVTKPAPQGATEVASSLREVQPDPPVPSCEVCGSVMVATRHQCYSCGNIKETPMPKGAMAVASSQGEQAGGVPFQQLASAPADLLSAEQLAIILREILPEIVFNCPWEDLPEDAKKAWIKKADLLLARAALSRGPQPPDANKFPAMDYIQVLDSEFKVLDLEGISKSHDANGNEVLNIHLRAGSLPQPLGQQPEVFTDDEVRSLNAFQRAGRFHPFTCGGNRTDSKHLDGEGLLVATNKGWICLYCDYRQDWAHDNMKNWTWAAPSDRPAPPAAPLPHPEQPQEEKKP